MNDFSSGIIQGLLGGVVDYGQGYLKRKQEQETVARQQQLEQEKLDQENKRNLDRSTALREILFPQGQQTGLPDIEYLMTDPNVMADPAMRETVGRIYNTRKQTDEQKRKEAEKREEEEKLKKGKNIYTVLANRGIDVPAMQDLLPTKDKQTQLSPEQEAQFDKWIQETPWFKELLTEYGSESKDALLEEIRNNNAYDYRLAFLEGEMPEINPTDKKYHWASKTKRGEDLKLKGHPTAWKQTFFEITGEDPDALKLKDINQAQQYLDKKFPGGKRQFSQKEITQLRGELATLSPALSRQLDDIIQRAEQPQYETGLYDPKTETIYDREYKTDFWTGEKIVTKPRMNQREKEKKNEYGQTTISGATKSVFDKDFKEYAEAKGQYDAIMQTGMVWSNKLGEYVPANSDREAVDYWKTRTEQTYQKAMSNLITMMAPAAREYLEGMPDQVKNDQVVSATSIREAYKDGDLSENDFQYLMQWFRLYHKTEIGNVR